MANNHTTIYNVTGANARVNVDSVHASTNVVNVDVKQLFASMRTATETAGLESEVSRALHHRIDAMEAATATQSFAQRYSAFMEIAANHVQVFQPFFPALAQLLSLSG